MVASLAGCIAPDVEVVGALGVTVDEQHRPVIVIEACDGATARVDLSLDREGLADEEKNEQVASWIPDLAVPGTSELALHAPSGPWKGEAVAVAVGRGYVATAVGKGNREVLSQVAFRSVDLAEMEPGIVYINDSDPDVRQLFGRSAEDFTAYVCSRR